MQTANRVIKNTGFLYAKMGITMFISLYTTRLILNALGATDFGIFNIVGGAIAMLGFLNTAMASATQRFMSFAEGAGDKDKQTKIFNISVILHFSIALFMILILILLGYFFFNGFLKIPEERIYAAKTIYYFMIFSTAFTIMTVPYDAVLNAHENMLYYSITGILESILKLIVAIIIVYSFLDKLILYGALMMIISIVIMLIKRIYCHKNYVECRLAPRQYYDKELMTEMATFAGWNFSMVAVSMITNYGMGVVLNVFFGTLLNAAQGVASQLSGQLGVFSGNMMKALAPIIAKTEGAGNREKMLKASALGAKISFMLSLFFMAPFIIDTNYVLTKWLSNVPNYAVIFCKLLLIQSLIESFLYSLSQSLSAQGNIKHATIVRTIHNIIYLPIIIFFFYRGFEPQSMYYIMIIKTIISIIITLYFNKKNCGLNIFNYLKNTILPCLFAMFCALSVLFLIQYFMPETLWRLVFIFISSLLVSSATLYLIVLDNKEQEIAKKTVVEIKKRITNVIKRKNKE